MNRLKRVLCIILLCCLTFSVPSQAAVPLDVTEDGLLEMLRALSCLGILYDMDSGGNFRPDDTVTRGEAALSAVQLLGIHVSGYTESDVAFTDVTDETPNHEAIRAAVVHGLLDGFGDGTFRPDDSITYEQMAKILVCALGYEPMAELTGGYPTGYLIQANDLDLFLGVQQMGAENLKRRDLAAMLFHALHAPMLLEVGYEGDSPKVIKDNSRTLLTERLHCVWGEGVVQANSYTSIYESVGVGNRRVKIGDLLFDVGETDVASMVGMYVTFYASENENGGYTIIGAWADDTRLLTLDAGEIVKEETSFRELACDMDGKIRRYRLSDAPNLIFNSTAAPLEDVSMLAPDAGTVILSDTDANGDFDVILVTAFQTRVVDVISGSRITFKDGSQPLDLEETDWAVDIRKNGAPASINEIAAWDVVQIAAPKYGNYGLCLVEVTDRKAGGNVTALSEDMIEIAGEEYTIAKEYASGYFYIKGRPKRYRFIGSYK